MLRVYLLYCLSGFVSLGYQVVWFRVGVDRFGSTNFTFALVLCNFIAGLGIGALVSKPFAAWLARISGIGDRLRLYGLVEVLVGLSALLTVATAAIPADAWGAFPYVLRDGIHEQTRAYQLAQVGIAALCVFLPCLFMGVTFPLLCFTFRRDGRFPSALYAWNTLGAASGVLACEFLLLPRVGHDATLWIMAGLNVGLGAFFLARGGAPADEVVESAHRPSPEPASGTAGAFGFVLTCAVLSGFLSGAVEADMLKRVWFVGGTTNAAMSFVSFWAILAIFLASSTVRLLRGLRLVHVKVAFVLAIVAYWLAWRFAYPLQPHFQYLQGLGGVLGYVGLFVFPAFLGVSLLLPYVLNRVQAGRRHLGLVYGANTIAFCLGMVAFSWIAPRVNVFFSMKLAMVLFAVSALFLGLLSERRPTPAWKPLGAVVLFALGCAFTPAGFDASFCGPANPAAHFPIRALRSNGAHTTYIIELPDGDTLTFDNHPMSGTQIEAQTYMRLMAHFPLLAQENPGRALLICFGVGNTASAIAAHETIRSIDVVDLNDQVIATAPEFAKTSNAVHLDPRVAFIHDDGRNWLNVTDRKYDLITSEPPPPMQTGVYRLYSQEYYERALEHLTPQGLMTQWLPIYQMPEEAVDLAISTFVSVFPHSILFTGREREFILMGGPAPIDLARVERRFYEQPGVVADLAHVRVHSPLSLLARVVKGEATLRREFAGRRVIRDQRNDLAYLFLDPTREAVITYDPRAMLADVDAGRLAAGDELERIVTDLGRLQYWVDEFPVDSMLSIRALGPGAGVRLADVDWRQARGLLNQTKRAPGPSGAAQREELMRRSLAICAEQSRVLLELAQLLAQTGRFDAALEPLRRFQALEPSEGTGYFGEGQALLGLGRQAEALVALRRAVELDPYRPEFLLSLAGLLRAAGGLEEAIEAYRAVVQLQPASRRARYELAGALEAAGRVNAASKQRQIAASLAEE